MRQNSAQRRGQRHRRSDQAPRGYSAAHRVSGAEDALADFQPSSSVPFLAGPSRSITENFLALCIILHS
jgi:hypothetical protein